MHLLTTCDESRPARPFLWPKFQSSTLTITQGLKPHEAYDRNDLRFSQPFPYHVLTNPELEQNFHLTQLTKRYLLGRGFSSSSIGLSGRGGI